MVQSILDYQKIDEKLFKIEVELINSDVRKKTMQARRFLDNVSENVANLDKTAHELSLAFENLSREEEKCKASLSEFDNALKDVDDESEVAYVQKKASELLDEVKRIEGDLSVVKERIADVLAKYSQLRKNTMEAQKQYNEYGQHYAELKESKKGEKAAIEKELSQAAKKVEPLVLAKYNEKRKDKIFPIVFELNGKLCSNCGMELSMLALEKLKKNKIAECDNCKRLLYTK